MTFHLTGLHLTSKRGRGKTGLSEKDLILNRAGLFDLNPAQTELMTICPKHRKNLTTDWQGRKSRVCCYPCHKGQRKQLEVHRRVNALMSAEIHQLFNTVVPIGSGKLLLIIIDVNLHLKLENCTRRIDIEVMRWIETSILQYAKSQSEG